jgi:hypothetical protein
MLPSPDAMLLARCDHIKGVVDDLARANGADSPVTQAFSHEH